MVQGLIPGVPRSLSSLVWISPRLLLCIGFDLLSSHWTTCGVILLFRSGLICAGISCDLLYRRPWWGPGTDLQRCSLVLFLRLCFLSSLLVPGWSSVLVWTQIGSHRLFYVFSGSQWLVCTLLFPLFCWWCSGDWWVYNCLGYAFHFFLKIGMTFAIFSLSGTLPSEKDRFIICVIAGVRLSLWVFSIDGLISSSPPDFLSCNLFISERISRSSVGFRYMEDGILFFR